MATDTLTLSQARESWATLWRERTELQELLVSLTRIRYRNEQTYSQWASVCDRYLELAAVH